MTPAERVITAGSMLKERPILFSADMVRAILDGRKTQTRRVVKKQPPFECSGCYAANLGSGLPWFDFCEAGTQTIHRVRSPYTVGQRLWVREAWGCKEPYVDPPGIPGGRKPAAGDRIVYRANTDDDYQWRDGSLPWRPSVHMPRWASRITLAVTDVRVARVQEISENDSKNEGCNIEMIDAKVIAECDPGPARELATAMKGGWLTARFDFEMLWDSINEKRGFGWKANPWVWVITFTRVAP